MKRLLIFIAIASAALAAFAATAFFTGRQEQVQTVTHQWVWRCEYNYNGQLIYRLFQTSCPSSIEVR